MNKQLQRDVSSSILQSIGQQDVTLVSMPFGILGYPSIGLGLLKGALVPLNISVNVLYFTLPFAEVIGTKVYQSIANSDIGTQNLLGEWIFSEALFGAAALDKEGYINAVLREAAAVPETEIELLLALPDKVEDFLNECVERILEQHPRIVGFTSVFQQQVASLALAKRIKATAPDIFIVLGGANCEGEMGVEVVRQFPSLMRLFLEKGILSFQHSCNVFSRANASLICKESTRRKIQPLFPPMDTIL